MEEKSYTAYIKEFKEGDLTRFEEFYEEVKTKVFYNIYALTKSHELAEDLLQETFVKFLNNLQNLDENHAVLGYLMVLSRNLTLDYFKKHNRVGYLEDEEISHSDEYEIDKNTLLEKIKGILKDKEFEIFTLHVLTELSFKEISELKKRPIGTILWSYNNSIKKIQKELNYEALR